ncbi:DUF5959 family protein [Streptomyces anulatus]|uniref:DUF5959 family protein n=1 Tax=Streptomyces anulatus TaxID=1892 RepID=UPI0036368784
MQAIGAIRQNRRVPGRRRSQYHRPAHPRLSIGPGVSVQSCVPTFVRMTVHDSPSTQIGVQVPVDVATGWLEENRLRLERVRKVIAQIRRDDLTR